ncbi:MAG: hypothetical protein MUF48_22170 [Pirellulaceae bacterium]|nr:hypothetical protein [Pirellulaceae bacterium]
MVNSVFQRPFDRVVINLAPAELPKQAASFDLPITLGVLAGSGTTLSHRFCTRNRCLRDGRTNGSRRTWKPSVSRRWTGIQTAGTRLPDKCPKTRSVTCIALPFPPDGLARSAEPSSWSGGTLRSRCCRLCCSL